MLDAGAGGWRWRSESGAVVLQAASLGVAVHNGLCPDRNWSLVMNIRGYFNQKIIKTIGIDQLNLLFEQNDTE